MGKEKVGGIIMGYGFNADKTKHSFKLKYTRMGSNRFRPLIPQSSTGATGEIKVEASNSGFEELFDSGNLCRFDLLMFYETSQKYLFNITVPTYGNIADNGGSYIYLGYYGLTLDNGNTLLLRLKLIKENSKYKLNVEYSTTGATPDAIRLNAEVEVFKQEII